MRKSSPRIIELSNDSIVVRAKVRGRAVEDRSFVHPEVKPIVKWAGGNTPELVGRVAMFPGRDKPIVASDLTIRIKTGPELLAEFLAGYLSYLYVSKYWVERAGGASGTMKKITRTQIAELPIPILALDAQERIVSQYRKTASVVQRIELLVEDVSEEIENLPAAFLRRILSGES